MKFDLFLFLLCLLLLSCQKEDKKKVTPIEKPKEITPPTMTGRYVSVVTLDNYAPYAFSDSGNTSLSSEKLVPGQDSKVFKGFSWDTLRDAYHVMGYTVYLTVRPWQRALRKFEEGSFEILYPTTKTPNREKKFFYSKEDTNFSSMNIYTKKDSKFVFKGISSLKGMNVGVIRGWSYGPEWEASKFLTVIKNESDEQNFEMLAQGRLPAIAAFSVIADLWLKKNKKEHLFKKHPSFAFNKEYLVSLKSNPNSIEKVKVLTREKKRSLNPSSLSKD